MLTANDKSEIMQKHQRTSGDTGSSEVQIALLTARIRDLQGHFSTHKKDVHSRVGLMKVVAKRRKLLKYLMKTNLTKYRELLQELDIRG